MKFNETRKFGVEIEFRDRAARWDETMSFRETIAAALTAAGIETVVESYNHRTRRHWKLTTDSSCGLELVSPVLHGFEGLNAVRKALEVLAANGVVVDNSCGLHVHHDAADFSVASMKRVVKLYSQFEGVIDQLHDESRRANMNSYCQSMTRIGEYFYEQANVERLISSINDRYYKVNLHAYTVHGTIEFRQHAGTLDADEAVRWIILSQAILERALRPFSAKRVAWQPFKAVLGAYGASCSPECKAVIAHYSKCWKEAA